MAAAPYDAVSPEKQLRKDYFHLAKVGLYRDFASSTILLLVFLGYFGADGDVDAKLSRAHSVFRLFCQTEGYWVGLRSFSKAFFNYPRLSSYGWVNAKGSDCMALLAWISVLVTGYQNDVASPGHVCMLDIVSQTAAAAREIWRTLNDHGLWLAFPCAVKLWNEERRFIRGYCKLARMCFTEFRFPGYAMKPKLHLMRHFELEHAALLANPAMTFIPNPLAWGCEQNEDFIGRACRLSRRADSRLLCTRVIKSIFAKGDILHRRWLKHGPKRPVRRTRRKRGNSHACGVGNR